MANEQEGRRGLSRQDFLKLSGGALAGAYALGADGRRASAQTSTSVRSENLGPGSVAFPVVSAELVGDRLYVGSRNLSPETIAVYDLASKEVTENIELLSGGGFVQGLTSTNDGGQIYAGIAHGSSNLYRYDTGTREVSRAAKVPVTHIRDLAASPDGKVYAGGQPSSQGVYEYDPDTGRLRNIGVTDPNAGQVRSLAATSETVFVGSGSNLAQGEGGAKLVAVDRASGTQTPILPVELAQDSTVYTLEISGNLLLAGTEGPHCHLAIINLDDYGDYTVVEPADEKTVDAVEVVGDAVYFTTRLSGTLWRHNIGDGRLEKLAVPQPYYEIWGLSYKDGLLVGTTSGGYAWTYEISTGNVELRDLVEAGAAASPEKAMSIAASAGRVFVGGNGGIGARDLETGSLYRLAVPGESKDMVFARDELFMAVYSSLGIWKYDPGGEPALAANVPKEQNRPQVIVYDKRNDLLLAGTQADVAGGGAFVVFDPRTGKLETHVNPLGVDQVVRSVASLEGAAYIGGSKSGFAAWDPVTGKELWKIQPVPGDGVSSLVALGKRVYGITSNGTFFVVDVRSKRVVNTEDFGSFAGGSARLVVANDRIYGASKDTLFRIDPDSYEHTVLMEGLSSDWFSGPRIAADEEGYVYVLKDTDVLRVSDK